MDDSNGTGRRRHDDDDERPPAPPPRRIVSKEVNETNDEKGKPSMLGFAEEVPVEGPRVEHVGGGSVKSDSVSASSRKSRLGRKGKATSSQGVNNEEGGTRTEGGDSGSQTQPGAHRIMFAGAVVGATAETETVEFSGPMEMSPPVATPLSAHVVTEDPDIESQVQARVNQERDEIAAQVHQQLVQGAVHADVVIDDFSTSRISHGEEPKETTCCNRQRLWILGVVLLVVLVGTIGAGVGASLASSPSPAPPPTASPTSSKSLTLEPITPPPTEAPTPQATSPPTSSPTKPPVTRCSLCADGTVPPNLDINIVFAGSDEPGDEVNIEQTCGEFQNVMASLDANDSICEANQAVAWFYCECPTLPPPPENPVCSICEDGSTPTGLLTELCVQMDNWVRLVSTGYSFLTCDTYDFDGACFCPGESPVTQPNAAPTLPPVDADAQRISAFRQLLLPLSGDTLDDPSSPQYEALEWLALTDDLRLPPALTPIAVVRQRFASAALYFATSGEVWTSQLGFLSAVSECLWNDGVNGLFCDSNEEIESILLVENGLFGTIPNEITTLSATVEIALSDNGLFGSFPVGIGNMVSLRDIELDNTNIGSALPDGLFTLPLLDRITMWNADLTGTLPATLSSATRLRVLGLFNAGRIGGTIPDISLLSGLTYFAVTGGALNGPLPTFENSRDLQYLWLNDNSFTGYTIPSTIGSLPFLRNLGLYSSGLSGPLPTFELNTGLLDLLYLYDNALTGQFEDFIASLPPSVTEIDIGDNNVDGFIPTDIGRLENLGWLRTTRNNLVSSVPATIGALTKLSLLSFNENDLSGPMPTEIGGMTNLQGLYLQAQRLTSTLPTELGQLTKLTLLSVLKNGMSGPVPSELGKLTDLTVLDIQFQGFNGTVPSELGELIALTGLGLSSTELQGTLPTAIAALPNLEILYIDNTGLSYLPPEFCARPVIGLDDINDFHADCFGATPEVDCPCCTICCDDESGCYE